MTKIKNIVAYPRDITITDEDYIIGTDGDTSDGKTKNYFFNNIRNYLLAGLAPEVGGTLKVTEISYTGVLTTPSEVANALNPIYNVLQYNIVIFSVNGDKYILGLQNVSIGFTETPVTEDDFITINANFKLGDGINLYKGTNASTGKEEHYALKSVGLNITKELDGSSAETGNVLIEQKQQTNLGDGVRIYKGFNSTSKLQEFYTASFETVGSGVSLIKDVSIIGDKIVFRTKGSVSNTVNITSESENVRYEIPETSEVLQFIVNSDYEGDEELGTVIKPFKNLQNALTAYQGTGTNNKNPQYSGYTIKVLKDVNEFTGSLAYANLIIDTDQLITSNPATGNYLCDVDSDATLPIGMVAFTTNEYVRITIKGSGGFVCKKRGVKNRGTQENSNSSQGKQIIISCILVASLEATDSNRTLIETNKENLSGYFNDSNVANIGLADGAKIITKNSNVITCGLNSKINGDTGADILIQFADNVVNFDVTIKPIVISGGFLNIVNCSLKSYLNGGSPGESNAVDNFITISADGSLTLQNCILEGYSDNLILNSGSTQCLVVLVNNSSLGMTVYNNLLYSPSVVWTNLILINNYMNGDIDNTQIVLSPNNINILNSFVVETLQTFSSKSAAQIAGLPLGSAFINRKVVTSGSFVIGLEYKISSIGTTNFTLIGASANTVGLYFTASGVGTGTGTADLIARDILI